MNEYTPTTEQVRRYWLYGADAWANGRAALSDTPDPVTGDRPSAQFDRWLEERDREVAARAWDAGYHSGELTPNPYREGS